jgi:hypothetical protein
MKGTTFFKRFFKKFGEFLCVNLSISNKIKLFKILSNLLPWVSTSVGQIPKNSHIKLGYCKL